jgi:ADP-ribose pyrophosphatase YjhB (NUDIX family)
MEAKQVFGRLPDDWQPRITPAFCSKCGSECRLWRDGKAHSVCTACGQMQFVNPTLGVEVLVADGDRVLLGRRSLWTGWGGRWCLPGGHVDFDEDFLTAGLRETLEETGVHVEVTGLLSVVSSFWQHLDSTLVAVLLARPLRGGPAANPEMSEVAWFQWDSLPEMAFEADAHVIERYFTTRNPGAPVDAAFSRLDVDPALRELPPAERYPK